jgi:hypothetical protein
MAVLGLAGCGPQMLKIPPNLGILKKWDSTEFSVSIDSPHFVQGLPNGRNFLINVFSVSITFTGFPVPFLGTIIFLVILIAAIYEAIKRVRQQDLTLKHSQLSHPV